VWAWVVTRARARVYAGVVRVGVVRETGEALGLGAQVVAVSRDSE